jgi:hypothetical protein
MDYSLWGIWLILHAEIERLRDWEIERLRDWEIEKLKYWRKENVREWENARVRPIGQSNRHGLPRALQLSVERKSKALSSVVSLGWAKGAMLHAFWRRLWCVWVWMADIFGYLGVWREDRIGDRILRSLIEKPSFIENGVEKDWTKFPSHKFFNITDI